MQVLDKKACIYAKFVVPLRRILKAGRYGNHW